MGTIERTPIFTVPDQPDFHDDIPQVQPLRAERKRTRPTPSAVLPGEWTGAAPAADTTRVPEYGHNKDNSA